MKHNPKKPVAIFRRLKHGSRQVIALFPYAIGSSSPCTCMSYVLNRGILSESHENLRHVMKTSTAPIPFSHDAAALKKALRSAGLDFNTAYRTPQDAFLLRAGALREELGI